MAGTARIRMYDVGFGDAFLLYLPTEGGERTVLVDCGSLKAGGRPLADVVARIHADTRGPDGASRIDVVVATHRHRDHCAGFSKPGWDQVHVGEVWLPWTEDPEDPEATRVREAQLRLALSLQATLQASPGLGTREMTDQVLNAVQDEVARDVLLGGFADRRKPRFLAAAATGTNVFTTPVLPGVKIHVLGPSRDEQIVRTMDPEGAARWLRAAPGDALEAPTLRAFPEPWALDSEDPLVDGVTLPPTWEAYVRKAGTMDLDLAVASLESAVNGTSLMLVFEIGNAHLLFPGDAQWGTWKAALGDPDRLALLERTSFYKVGHHGSHNATPRSFVSEHLGSCRAAMVPVTSYSRWKEIPKQELIDMLGSKLPVLRSDRLSTAGPEFQRSPEGEDWWAEARIPC